MMMQKQRNGAYRHPEIGLKQQFRPECQFDRRAHPHFSSGLFRCQRAADPTDIGDLADDAG